MIDNCYLIMYYYNYYNAVLINTKLVRVVRSILTRGELGSTCQLRSLAVVVLQLAVLLTPRDYMRGLN
jgi:hypothetical protein